jgi:hypothetical protein
MSKLENKDVQEGRPVNLEAITQHPLLDAGSEMDGWRSSNCANLPYGTSSEQVNAQIYSRT